MDPYKCTLALCVTPCILATWFMILSANILAVDLFDDFEPYRQSGTVELMDVYEMGRNWERNTFTDMKVITGYDCGDGWEAAYERIHYGLEVACDCIGIYSKRGSRIRNANGWSYN